MNSMHMEPVIIEDLVKFGEDRGFDRGANRALTSERVRMLEVRLGRTLDDVEQARLKKRVATVTTERLFELLPNPNPDALEAWLADPNAQ